MRYLRSQKKKIALISLSAEKTEMFLSESSSEVHIVAGQMRAIQTMKGNTTRECRG